MSEKRLIDAFKLIDALPVVTEDKKITLYGAVADFLIMISAMPTEDAVEVVRCKHCTKRPKGQYGVCNVLCRQTHEDDFCSYGERRSE